MIDVISGSRLPPTEVRGLQDDRCDNGLLFALARTRLFTQKPARLRLAQLYIAPTTYFGQPRVSGVKLIFYRQIQYFSPSYIEPILLPDYFHLTGDITVIRIKFHFPFTIIKFDNVNT